MAMGIFNLINELELEESNVKYVKRMHCDFGKVWYETIRVESPRYQALYEAVRNERVFTCRCCGEKVSYLNLADKTEGDYLCWDCAPNPWEFEDDEEFNEEEFEV